MTFLLQNRRRGSTEGNKNKADYKYFWHQQG